MNIVLFGDWGPAFLTFARVCKANGVACHFLEVTDGAPKNARRYSSAITRSGTIRRSDINTPQGIDAIKQYMLTENANALISLSDTYITWLADNRGVFEPEHLLLIADQEALHRLASKRYQIGIAERAGFRVLPTWYISSSEDSAEIPLSEYPVALRPDNAQAVNPEFKVKLIHTESELNRFIQPIEFINGSIIAQPFQNVPNLVVHGVRSPKGNVLALQAFLVARKFEGVGLSIQATNCDSDLARACVRFVEMTDIAGPFHFDLLHDPASNQSYFLEINTRLGGTTDKVTRLGFNEPLLTLQAYGLAPAGRGPASRVRPGTAVNRRAILKHMLWCIQGRLSALDYPVIGRLGHLSLSISNMLFGKDSMFDWRDIRGSMWFYLRM